jgi:hypothetical protein
MATLKFPPDAIECRSGDYLLKTIAGSHWQVFRVQELVLISRLIPLSSLDSVELIEEKHALDSVRPWRMDEIHLLITAFSQRFGSEEAAIQAIEDSELGESVSDLCLGISNFPRDSSRVYKMGQNPT